MLTQSAFNVGGQLSEIARPAGGLHFDEFGTLSY